MLKSLTRYPATVGALAVLLSVGGCNAAGNKALLGGAAGAAMGGFLGNKLGGGTAGTVAGVALGGLGGYLIGNMLDEADKAELDRISRQSAETGTVQRFENPRTGVKATVSSAPAAPRREIAQVPVVRSVKAVPPLEPLNRVFVATRDTAFYSGPAASYSRLGDIRDGQVVSVRGKVSGQPWYLIEQDKIGRGFVSAASLRPWTAPSSPPAAPALQTTQPANEEVKQVQADLVLECRTQVQNVELRGQKPVQESGRVCKDSDGNWFRQNQA